MVARERLEGALPDEELKSATAGGPSTAVAREPEMPAESAHQPPSLSDVVAFQRLRELAQLQADYQRAMIISPSLLNLEVRL